jgi:hypothetical protein
MPQRGAPRRGRGVLLAAAAAQLVASAGGVALPSSWSTTTPVSALGVAGAPNVATPFFSYHSNFQFMPVSDPSNQNFNVLRARPARIRNVHSEGCRQLA